MTNDDQITAYARALAALFRAEGMVTDAETIERQLARYPEVPS